MPKPPQTYIQGNQAKKNAVLAKDAKEKIAIAKANQQAAFALDLLRKSSIDRRQLAEIKSLAEAVKKGPVPDQKRQALLKGIKRLIELAKHSDELAKANASLGAPAKAVIHEVQHLAGTGPNFISALAVILLFIMVLDKFLAKPRPPGK